jgi:hypothetical protein
MNRDHAVHGGTVLSALIAAALWICSTRGAEAGSTAPPAMQHSKGTTMSTTRTHPYVGVWVTQDGRIRHELLHNGRYDEARGKLKSAYQGRYRVTGHHIDYVDDTGFTADGEFRDGILYHAGMVLYRSR